MKKAFIVTSAIEVNNDHPLTYSATRSSFSTEARLQHTVMSIASLDLLSDHNTTIYLLDISDNWTKYKDQLSYQKNLKFISVKDQFPEIYHIVTTHANKSHCETLLLATFVHAYRQELAEFDYTFKLSGRYFLDSTFDKELFNQLNTDAIFFKKPLQFNWNPDWGYALIDQRANQGDNMLRQYCTVAYGWGKDHNSHMLDLFTGIAALLAQPEMIHMDVESLMYFFTRPLESSIIETSWLVYGWDGTSGKFMRY